MQRIINNPDRVVEDMLVGIVKAHSDRIAIDGENPRVVKSICRYETAKVGVVTGGEMCIRDRCERYD